LRSPARKIIRRMPRIGSSSRAMMFHTPVTISEVEMARRVNPQDRSCLYVAAAPAAPPAGSRLPTADPQMLTTNALTCGRCGSDPVNVNV
jgi:hypothetical protein